MNVDFTDFTVILPDGRTIRRNRREDAVNEAAIAITDDGRDFKIMRSRVNASFDSNFIDTRTLITQ